MAEHMTDEEQLQILKNWWKQNGTSLVAIVALVLAGYFGWQWWNNYQQRYAEEASSLYIELSELLATEADIDSLSDDKRSTVSFLIEQLQNDYGRTLYAANASLLAAKLAVAADDLSTAEEELLKAADHDVIKPLANLRLARVYFAQGKLDEALATANYESDDEFTGLYAVVRGDVLVAKGDTTGAKAAYEQALATLPKDNSSSRRLVTTKLANLGGA